MLFAALLSISCVAGGDVLTYRKMLEAVSEKKLQLSARFLAATSHSVKSSILSEASELLESELTQNVFPAWYGTKWDFNGISETPRVGVIACGYFVSTTLRDIGFQLNRFRIAQLYSHEIVNRLSSSARSYPILSKMLEEILKQEDQVYLVGLDQHVGFLHKRDKEIRFIHSSYGNPQEVLSENAFDSQILKQSKSYVLGRLSHNNQLVKKWLLGQKF